jgi:hypothetical protein
MRGVLSPRFTIRHSAYKVLYLSDIFIFLYYYSIDELITDNG